MSVVLCTLSIFSTLAASQYPIIEQIQNAYQNNSIKHEDPILAIDPADSDSIVAAKNYFTALLHNDMQQTLLIHATNFATFPAEHYGQMSGVQLVIVDFINHEYDKALLKLEQIGVNRIPDALYWRAKITQLMQRHDEAITLCQNFIRQFPNSSLIPQVWLILLETHYHNRDLTSFERGYRTFLNHQNFNEYKPYLLYLNALLIERTNLQRARALYSQIINEFPLSQYRIQAEDRLYALGVTADRTTASSPPPPPRNDSPQTSQRESNDFREVVASRYEDLVKDTFYIQFGVFSTENAAKNLLNNLNKDNVNAFHITKPVGGRRLFAVVQGPYQTLANAQSNQRTLSSKNYQTFIFKVD